jgi:hypothetical protein
LKLMKSYRGVPTPSTVNAATIISERMGELKKVVKAVKEAIALICTETGSHEGSVASTFEVITEAVMDNHYWAGNIPITVSDLIPVVSSYVKEKNEANKNFMAGAIQQPYMAQAPYAVPAPGR